MIRRGEIYWINLDPTVGSEIKKTRPGLVVSNDEGNLHSDLITVLPITSQTDKVYPFEVFIKAGEGGLKESGKIKANQIRTIDKRRIAGGPLGPHVNDDVLLKVEDALKIHLDFLYFGPNSFFTPEDFSFAPAIGDGCRFNRQKFAGGQAVFHN